MDCKIAVIKGDGIGPEIIDETIKEVNPVGLKDMGILMKNLVPKFNGQADMSLVNELVRKKLN